MEIEENITHLLITTLRTCLSPDVEITSIVELVMTGEGYSGAQMRRFDVQYASYRGSGERISLVVKDASFVERRTLLHLYRQGHPCIPFCHTLDLEKDARVPICMQFIVGESGKLSPEELNRAAEAVAAIHVRNLKSRLLLEWLPSADRTFVESGYVLGTFRTAWARALTDVDFSTEYGQFTAALEDAALRFMQCVEEIWQEGDTITLIHGDLHSGNVVTTGGQPYIIDWEHARFGSFYLDLPNLFPGENVRSYYRALAHSGVVINERQFTERYREMGRYVGFKYIAFVLSHWHQRDDPGSWVRGGLENLLNIALNGAKPYKD